MSAGCRYALTVRTGRSAEKHCTTVLLLDGHFDGPLIVEKSRVLKDTRTRGPFRRAVRTGSAYRPILVLKLLTEHELTAYDGRLPTTKLVEFVSERPSRMPLWTIIIRIGLSLKPSRPWPKPRA